MRLVVKAGRASLRRNAAKGRLATGAGSGRCGGGGPDAVGRVGLGGGKRRVVDIERRAIGTHDLAVAAHVQIDMRVIERRLGANALKFLRADLYAFETGVVLEVGDDTIRHRDHPSFVVVASCADHTQEEGA